MCFFLNVPDGEDARRFIELRAFYSNDIRGLEAIFDEVVVVRSIWQVIWHRPDVWYCWWWGHSLVPCIWGLVCRTPVYVTGAFDYDSAVEFGFKSNYVSSGWLKRLVIRLTLKLASRCIFVSNFDAQKVTRNFKIRDWTVLPHSVDLNDFDYKYREKSKSTESSKYFVTGCWLEKQNVVRKGVETSIRSIGRLRDEGNTEVKLFIYGPFGNALEPLNSLIESLELQGRVLLMGSISQKHKISLLATCLGYLQPSLHEGFGLAALEALAMGVPVIATRQGGLAEVLGDFSYVVDPLRDDQIANKIIDILNQSASELILNKPQVDYVRQNFALINRLELLRKCLS